MHAAVAVPPAIVVGAGEVCPNEDQMQLTDVLRKEYEDRFAGLRVLPAKDLGVAATIAKILRCRARYETVAAKTDVPWYVIAILHSLECSSDFACHLANGDPLDARTVNVPKGRPVTGAPPFTWEDSAVDALTYDHFCEWRDWTIAGTLYKFEAWNGWGYRVKGVPTPYLWSSSNWYSSGKFVRDSVFDRRAVSSQIGAAVLLHRLRALNIVSLSNDSSASNSEEQKGPTL